MDNISDRGSRKSSVQLGDTEDNNRSTECIGIGTTLELTREFDEVDLRNGINEFHQTEVTTTHFGTQTINSLNLFLFKILPGSLTNGYLQNPQTTR